MTADVGWKDEEPATFQPAEIRPARRSPDVVVVVVVVAASDGRKGRPWRRLREQVLREEPWCYVCGRPSTCVDHYLPLSKYPTLAHVRANLRGCCRFHNLSKGDRIPSQRPPSTSVTRLQW